MDGEGLDPQVVYRLINDVAAQHPGWDHESMRSLINRDPYTPPGNNGAANGAFKDCFDVFEVTGGARNGGTGACSMAIRGVFVRPFWSPLRRAEF